MVDSVALFDKTKKSVDDSYIVHGFFYDVRNGRLCESGLEPKATTFTVYFA